MISLLLLLRWSSITHHIYLYTANTGPPCWMKTEVISLSVWIWMSWISPGIFVFKNQAPLLCCLHQTWMRRYTRTLGLCAFHAGHREVMDSFVSLSRFLTATCDALKAALKAGIQPRLQLHKWSEPHWFRIYMINVISTSVRRVNTCVSKCHNLFMSCLTTRKASWCHCKEMLHFNYLQPFWNKILT